ncbi:hypothetical protein AAV94_08165 [Lampropedia cohaerens]|uniref:Uncharacterized protein n=1 Tax=Lampropedia cohaerens TaxID=1610491 RepID=A0A0U1PZC6_9BURK|nr:hypothetical protein AAV94_08165 [Lampropedia cohaerens]
MGDPTLEGERAIEKVDVRESSLAEQIDILHGRKHGQPFLDRRDAAFGLTHGYAGSSREHRIAREPSVPTGIFAGKV